jgi:polyribonucleotide nucleotidyltransferase
VHIKPERIRDLIGPGGKHIRGIQDATGVQIERGRLGKIASPSAATGPPPPRPSQMIRGLTQEAEIGEVYLGVVVRIRRLRRLRRDRPGTEGLVPHLQLANERVRETTDVVAKRATRSW